MRAPLMLQTILGLRRGGHRARPFWSRRRRWASAWCARRARSSRPASRFACPSAPSCAERLDAVLEAIYAAFAEGWSDPAGTEARRRNLAEEGIWLGRLVASLLPEEPEALGLLVADAARAGAPRRAARRDAASTCRSPSRTRRCGTRPLIDEAEALLLRASALGRSGRYQLEAAVQSAHVDPPPHRPRRLGGDRAALRRAARAHRLAGGRDQPRRRAGARRAAPRRGLAALDAVAGRCALARLSAVLGGARRAFGAGRRKACRQQAYSARSGSNATRRCGDFCRRRATR